MFLKDITKFIWLWVILAFLPLIANIIFDFAAHSIRSLEGDILELSLLFVLPAFAAAFAAFLFVSIWVAFRSKVALHTKLILIILAYLLIWLSFGNLFYFFSCIESFIQIKDILSYRLPITDTTALVDSLSSNTLSTLKTFWNLSIADNQITGLTSVNRAINYFDCLYFSGVNILTIGFGDIVPISRFLKFLVLLESFLGMIINVLAVGMWLSTANKN